MPSEPPVLAVAHRLERPTDIPPGWDHNPTSARRRVLLAALACAGLLVAGYLTLFQIGVLDHAWDPFFDSRTVLELTAPVPDALAGVAAYAAELVLLAAGGRDRWRSLPWACLALGLTLAAGAAVSVALIVIQPTVAGAWCTLCLVSAALSLALFALGIGEARAAWQHVARARARGARLGDAVWGRAASLSAVLVALILGGCGGGGERPAATATPVADLQAAYNRVVETVSPSVVQIETRAGLGSGVVFDRDGNIVTNAHVVGDAQRFTVTLASGKRVSATLVGRWAPGDLAVIRADAGGLRPAALADSSALSVGDIVMAIGNPLGLRSSVTQGIVSSLGRTVSEGQGGSTIAAAIQTSAAINPGNSGGALVDLQGRLVGIPTLAAVDPQLGGGAAPGIGFAIPSNTVQSIARQLIDDGAVTESGRASLGVRVATVTGGGVVIVEVEDGGPADEAGLRRGEIIVALDGQPAPDVSTLTSRLAGREPGQAVTVTVRGADGERHDRRVTLGELSG